MEPPSRGQGVLGLMGAVTMVRSGLSEPSDDGIPRADKAQEREGERGREREGGREGGREGEGGRERKGGRYI